MKDKVGFRVRNSSAYLISHLAPSGRDYNFFKGRWTYIKVKEDIEFFRKRPEMEEEGKSIKPKKKKKGFVKKVKSALKKKKKKK